MRRAGVTPRGAICAMVLSAIAAATTAHATPVSLPQTITTGLGVTQWYVEEFGPSATPFGGSCSGNAGLNINDANGANGSGDAFDIAYAVYVDGALFDAGSIVDLTGTTITAGPVGMSGLDVTVEYFFSTARQVARVLASFENPSAGPISVNVDIPVNFGSDGSTTINGTSSGDLVFSLADRWIVTSDGGPFDPVNTTVLYGPGGPPVVPSSVTLTVFNCAGTPGVGASYTVTVPAGASASLLLFAGLGDIDGTGNTIAGALANAPQFDSTASIADLLVGVPNDVVNWNFATCGDGNHEPPFEECDDGDLDDGDGCDSNCTVTACGNGIVTSGEQCDDGDVVPGDCCDATCQTEAAGSPCPDDGNACSDDVCNAGGVCLHPANAAPCNDGLFCNGADTCGGGTCSVHAGDPCASGAECNDGCNESADSCLNAPGTPCSADGNACTDDVCDGFGACGVALTGTACEDGNPCSLGDLCSVGTCQSGSARADIDACLDDFLCYKSKRSQDAPKFQPVPGVLLTDQFETRTVDAVKSVHLCTPADKNGEGTVDLATHLRSYKIKMVAGSAKHVRQTNVRILNQLGELRLDTVKADLLFVPTAKNLVTPPPPPDPASHGVDHYKCYQVKVTKGTPKFPKGVQVTASDQFTTPAKLFDLKKPRHLCNPVDKNGEGIENPLHHLVCYQAKPASGQPKHQAVLGVEIDNQFGPETIDVVKEQEFCIPSFKNPACGDGEVNQPSEQCDDGNVVAGDCCSDTCQTEDCLVGVQTNVPIAGLINDGWTQCHLDTYADAGTPLSTILAACNQANLLLGCRPTGAANLQVAAAAPRTDVIFDTGTSNTPHDANGVGWYFNDDWSWGFAVQGDPIDRDSCDIEASSFGPGPNPDKRLCWHTSGGSIDGGWRCGADDSLNGNASFERLIFQKP